VVVESETVYLQAALELVPYPAALMSWPGMEFISNNEASQAVFQRHDLGDAEAVTEAHVDADDGEVRQHLLSLEEGKTVARHDDLWGLTYFTLMSPPAAHARPPLIVVTCHEGDEANEDARLEHLRAVMTIRVNESVDAALATLDTALKSLATVGEVSREFLEEYNKRATDLWERKFDQGG
jgi:hypothetical protein